ncbi:MAG TPA: CBS domain-containing protein [Myxococcota bacterium]|nr:CBS domain-containing protein [Myxococcota bacterium]
MVALKASSPMYVRDLMSHEVTSVRRNDRLSLVDDVMRLGRVRHLPVVDDEDETKIVGLVSLRDLFRGSLARALGYGTRAQQKLLDMLVVKEVMTTELVTTTPNTPLTEAARLMAQRKLGCLPVIEEGKLVGILTEGDFVSLAAKG